jgi:hypothetical protein
MRIESVDEKASMRQIVIVQTRQRRRVLLRATLLAVLGLLLCSLADSFSPRKPPYDQGKVTEPRLFAEGVISTEDDEINGAFTPDGTEYYFSKVNQYTNFPRIGIICVSRFVNGVWTQPEVVPFSGQYLDLTPRFSPDGKKLYFTSMRPAPETNARVLRIWSVQRETGGWGKPQPLPAPINVDDHWNWGASVTRDGAIYFASSREAPGNQHIFRSRLVNGRYTEPEKLGPEINSAFNEGDPFVSPDEHVLIFSSSGTGPPEAKDRPETIEGGGLLYARADLYASVFENGKWSKAKHLEHNVNSSADEGSPSITPDGKYVFFTSERSPFTVPTSHPLSYQEIERLLHSTLNGHGNVFFISTEVLELPVKKEPR